MDRNALRSALTDAFAADPAELDEVVRAASDLADSGRLVADLDVAVTPAVVVSHLRDAPGGGLADRWNWWMGSLEIAFGGYRRFEVRTWEPREDQ